jgi:hypothetical protein
MLLPERYRDRHIEYRRAFFANPRTRPMAAKLQLSTWFGRQQ